MQNKRKRPLEHAYSISSLANINAQQIPIKNEHLSDPKIQPSASLSCCSDLSKSKPPAGSIPKQKQQPSNKKKKKSKKSALWCYEDVEEDEEFRCFMCDKALKRNNKNSYVSCTHCVEICCKRCSRDCVDKRGMFVCPACYSEDEEDEDKTMTSTKRKNKKMAVTPPPSPSPPSSPRKKTQNNNVRKINNNDLFQLKSVTVRTQTSNNTEQPGSCFQQ